MAVDMVKPDPADDEDLAEVVELHLVDEDQDDEGADDVPRLRAFSRPRRLVRTYMDVRGSGRAIKVGTVVMVAAIRKRRRGTPAPAAPAAAEAGEQQGSGTGEQKQAPAKKPPKAPRKGGRKFNGNAVMAGLVLVPMGLGAVAANLDRIIWLVVIIILIWIPVAWVVGGFVLAGQPDEDEGQDDEAGEESPEDDGEDGEPADEEGESGDTGQERPALSHEAATQQVYAWLRGHVEGHPGVHLQTLVDDLNNPPRGKTFTIADVQRLLDAHGVPWKPQQKAPDWAKGGRVTNRAGVARTAVPQEYTPVETPGAHHVRLLPPYQAPDQQ